MRATRAGWGWVVAFSLLLWAFASGGELALAQAEAQAPPTQSQTGEALGPWATAAFVWLVLILAMGFVVAMGWFSRSRRF